MEGDRQVSLLAQDVELVIPEVVCYPFGWEQSKGSLGLAYERLTVILIKAAQEQQQIIDSLNLRVLNSELKNEILEANDARQSADLEYIKRQLGIDLTGKK